MRGLVDGDEAAMSARIEEIRDIASKMDDAPFSAGMQVSELDPTTGYAASSAHYDDVDNPLIEVEQPIVVEMVRDVDAGRALDAACGTGRHSRHLAERHEVFGVDASPEMLAVAEATVPNGTFRTGDLNALPFDEGSFDVVVCALAICHLADIRAGIAEIGRVARKGAKVVISDPHPTSVAILSHLFVPTDDGGLGFVRNHRRLVGDYLAAFDQASLRIVRCVEPLMGDDATVGFASDFVPDAVRRALAGLPAAIVWELERV